MCTGIILKGGKHLFSVNDVEQYFNISLENFKNCSILNRNNCLCQIDLEKLMNQDSMKNKFDFDNNEYWEK